MTLERIRGEANSYPADVLHGCESGLLLFAGGFRGRNDGIWFQQAGVRCDCVDVDPSGLREMEKLYPSNWRFFCTDAFPYVEKAAADGRMWDVVSVDCPTTAFDGCAAAAPLWCSVARSTVVLGCGTDTVIDVPDGWQVSAVLQRSGFNGGVFWTVLQR